MSSAFDCCLPCPPGTIPSANVVNIPGPQGDPGTPGAAGAAGADGKNAFSVSQSISGTLLPKQGNTVSVLCNTVAWMELGQNVFMSGTNNHPSPHQAVANFRVISKDNNTNTCVLIFLAYNGDESSGETIATGAGISPGGVQSVIPAGDYFVSRFISDQKTIAFGSILNTAHGLTGAPEILQIRAVAQTTGDGKDPFGAPLDGGYTVGDELDAMSVMVYAFPSSDSFEYSPFSVGCNAANVWIQMNWSAGGPSAPGYYGFVAPIKGGTDRFVPDILDASKWKIKLVAVKLNAP